jgi:hypothetical protein
MNGAPGAVITGDFGVAFGLTIGTHQIGGTICRKLAVRPVWRISVTVRIP